MIGSFRSLSAETLLARGGQLTLDRKGAPATSWRLYRKGSEMSGYYGSIQVYEVLGRVECTARILDPDQSSDGSRVVLLRSAMVDPDGVTDPSLWLREVLLGLVQEL
jgi:hypothetical protein